MNLIQGTELSLGSFEVRESIAATGALQQLRDKVSKFVQPVGSVGQRYTQWFEQCFWIGCWNVLTWTIVAVLYRQFLCATPSDLMDKLGAQQGKEGFEFPLFSLDKCDPQLALCSVFCLCIRWPATVSNERLALIAFWPAFFMFACLDGFAGIFCGLLWFVQVGICVYFRQKIREHYGLPQGTGMSYLEDILSWACCCICAGAQEAKQMEYVRSP